MKFHPVSGDLQVMEWPSSKSCPYLPEQYNIPAEILVEGRLSE